MGCTPTKIFGTVRRNCESRYKIFDTVRQIYNSPQKFFDTERQIFKSTNKVFDTLRQNCNSHRKNFETNKNVIFWKIFWVLWKPSIIKMVRFCKIDLRCGRNVVQCLHNGV